MSAAPIRIVSYNVRYFGHALRGLASTHRAKRGIATALAALRPLPDVVCLQEVETISLRSSVMVQRQHPAETQLETFMAALEEVFAQFEQPFPYEAYYFRAHDYRVGDTSIYTTGLAVLVNLHTLRVDEHNAASPHHITHHHVAAWRDRKQSRICAHVRLSTPAGRAFHVFNTHLSLPTPFARQFWAERDKMGFGVNQVQEARTLSEFVARHAEKDPFLVTGDFNSAPGSPVYRYFTHETGWTGAQALLGQVDLARPRAFPTAGFMQLRMHLDHLFSSRDVGWLDLDGTHAFGDTASPFHGLSDHVPLIGRFLLPG